MTTNNTGGRTGGIEQDFVKLTICGPSLWLAAITLFNFCVELKALKIFVYPGQALFIDIDGKHMRFRGRFQNMRCLTARCAAELQDHLAILRIQQIHASLCRSILYRYPTISKTWENMHG